MNKRNLLIGAGTVALAAGLVVLPSISASRSSQQDDTAKLEQKVRELQSAADTMSTDRALRTYVRALEASQEVAALQQPEVWDFSVLLGDEGASWLGVETEEVSSDFAKEHKLSVERGVVIHKVTSDSPAAKGGLKENDVVTAINGQAVEGTAQFRRMIREIPAGRTVQLTVTRDGHPQNISVTLGSTEHAKRVWSAPPGAFSIRIPDMPEIAQLPRMEWNNGVLLGGLGGQPRLGIDAEDLSGQLGAFFGAPDGEGILVREVNSGSPAEKAGLKAGDVITSLNGERIRTIGELREKLSAQHDEKGSTVKLSVLRNKGQVSLSVDLPALASRLKHVIRHRTSI